MIFFQVSNMTTGITGVAAILYIYIIYMYIKEQYNLISRVSMYLNNRPSWIVDSTSIWQTMLWWILDNGTKKQSRVHLDWVIVKGLNMHYKYASQWSKMATHTNLWIADLHTTQQQRKTKLYDKSGDFNARIATFHLWAATYRFSIWCVCLRYARTCPCYENSLLENS